MTKGQSVSNFPFSFETFVVSTHQVCFFFHLPRREPQIFLSFPRNIGFLYRFCLESLNQVGSSCFEHSNPRCEDREKASAVLFSKQFTLSVRTGYKRSRVLNYLLFSLFSQQLRPSSDIQCT